MLLVAAALAAPTFTGAPEDVELATIAWRAAEICTGRTPTLPSAAATVPIVRDLASLDGAGLAGLTNWGSPKGPWWVRLAPNAPPTTLAHEIAHAWIHSGVSNTLIEGRTDLLTRCVQAAHPDRFDDLMERRSSLEKMPDLLTWREDPLRVSDPDASVDAYLGSFRLFRALATAVPPELLFAEGLETWEDIAGVLAGQAGPASSVLDTLRSGAAAQREALLDADLDGASALYERLTGTDPVRYDTDGDGWWDGIALRPEGAVPLPRSAHPVCLPALPPGDGPVLVELGGQLGGIDHPARIEVDTRPGAILTWESGWRSYPGGLWIRAAGEGWRPNPNCGMRPGITVRGPGTYPAGALDTLAAALQAQRPVYTGLAGRPRDSIVVTVRGSGRYLTRAGTELVLPETALSRDAAEVARQIAAYAVLLDTDESARAIVAAALVREALPGAPVDLLDAPAFEITQWSKARKRCPTGWAGILDRSCARPW
ncbi:MAG: hypothetical protein ACK4YP_03280 [Myxococcota bacterium]